MCKQSRESLMKGVVYFGRRTQLDKLFHTKKLVNANRTVVFRGLIPVSLSSKLNNTKRNIFNSSPCFMCTIKCIFVYMVHLLLEDFFNCLVAKTTWPMTGLNISP